MKPEAIRTLFFLSLTLDTAIYSTQAYSCATSDSDKDGPRSAELDWETFKKRYDQPKDETQLGLSDDASTSSAVAASLDIFDEHGSVFAN